MGACDQSSSSSRRSSIHLSRFRVAETPPSSGSDGRGGSGLASRSGFRLPADVRLHGLQRRAAARHGAVTRTPERRTVQERRDLEKALGAHAARRDALERVHERRERDLRWVRYEQADVVQLVVRLDQLALEVGTDLDPRDARFLEDSLCDHLAAIFRDENQVCVELEHHVSASAKVTCGSHRPIHNAGVRIRKSFRYRVYPTPAQADRLAAWEHALRFLWNIAHEQRLMAHGSRCKVDARYPTAFDQINELTALRAELPWLADVPRNVAAQALCELDKAWQRCFKRLSRAPRWKRKGRDTVPLCEPHHKLFAVGNDTITFPKIGALRAVIHRPLVGKPKTCALVRDGDAWFAAVACEYELPDPLPSTKPAVAIDRGVVNLLADSNGRIVPNPRPLEALKGRIARAQRTVARRKKGSKNQQKARVRVARLQRKARRQRDAVLHRESHHYAKNHGTVIVERLDIRSMTASARGSIEQPGVKVRQKAGLNRAILDSGWGRFVEMLRYKVVPVGGAVVEVPAAYSSQTCADCGVVDAASRRSQSEFECVACGHRANADVNAAKVLYTRGSHGGAGCGGAAACGRPMKQQLRVARRGTRLTGEAKASAFRPG